MAVKTIWRKSGSIILTFMVAFLLLAFISIVKPGYANAANLNVLSISVAVLGLTALGQTLPILTGGMDLSIPWMFCIGGYLCAGLTAGDNNKLFYAIPIVLIAGLIMGTFNGLGIAYVGIAPVIMTMASNIIFQGLLVGITEGTPGGSIPGILKIFATKGSGVVGWIFLFWLLVSFGAWIILSKTPYGRKIYAVGNSETCALYSGINVKFLKLSAYAVCGMMAALAGMLYAGKVSQLYLGMGDTYQMASVSAVAIGGVSLVGGSGSYVGTMAGCFVIVILESLLAAMNFSQGIQKIIYGIVLFLAVMISSRKKKAES
ncbi:ABC transporter permease [Mediterraneibacter sp. ICN-202921]|uniref:ABC transporter permease n=1 Tax=Mediterraneibacter sp. ICN-202921 TaxID=3134657 RepID=UPI0030C47ECE